MFTAQLTSPSTDDAYDFDQMHVFMVNAAVDFFSCIFVSSIIFHRFGDCVTTQRFVQDWLTMDLLAEQAGKSECPYSTAWPSLPASALAKSMEVWKVSWGTAAGRFEESRRFANKFAWSREGGGRTASSYSKPALLLSVQAAILARMPEGVEESEAQEFLPSAGVCKIQIGLCLSHTFSLQMTRVFLIICLI